MSYKRALQLLVVLLFAAECSTAMGKGNEITLKVNGIKRTCVIYIPQNFAKDRPLVIALHGRWGSGSKMAEATQFADIADTARFAVAYPDGLVRPELGGGNNTGWDANGATDDDVKFFKKIICYMARYYGIDRNRVYLCGFSLGGMMTYHCINVVSNLFAAFASVCGYRLNEYRPSFSCARRVPILHIHGKDDGFVKYENLQPLVDKWVEAVSANPVPVLSEKIGVFTRRHYLPLKGGYEYDFYSLDHYGHEYRNTLDFNVSSIVWNFFCRYTLHAPLVYW